MHPSPNLAISLHHLIGQQIVAGEFEHRPFPNEADLATQFDASRTVIREAMKMLTAKGLINTRQRANRLNPMRDWNLLDPDISRWLRQRAFSAEAYREYMQMRLGIEPVAAGLTAALGDHESLADIDHSLKAMQAAPPASPARLEAQVRFHQALLRGSGNLFFNRLTELVTTALHMEAHLLKPESDDLSLYAQIHAGIRQGDVTGAEALMRALLRARLKQAEAYS